MRARQQPSTPPAPRANTDAFLERWLPGTSPAIIELRTRVALLNSPRNLKLVRNVLITGESGAGKNQVARLLAAHRQWLFEAQKGDGLDSIQTPSAYAAGHFAEISLPGLSDELVESELFGHRKGAFTGAASDHPGYFGEGYSDILLDEIGDASARLQAKLLRVLNSGEYRPVGGRKEDEGTTDARILMATHRPLAELARIGKFRADLLWRMREVVLRVPSLHEQQDNLTPLAELVLDQLQQEVLPGLQGKLTLAKPDLEFIKTCAWPGNVRQLRHVLARWLIHGGSLPLEVVVRECDAEEVAIGRTATADELDISVLTALDAARLGKTALAGTVGDFVDSHSDSIRRTLAHWLDRARPTPKELETMFPKTSGANAIRATIGKWRKL